jgi:hypothetical protein
LTEIKGTSAKRLRSENPRDKSLFSHFANAGILAKWLGIWGFCQP